MLIFVLLQPAHNAGRENLSKGGVRDSDNKKRRESCMHFSEKNIVIFITTLTYIFKIFIYLFIWLCRVLVAAHGIFSCSMWDPSP